jgi:hypothetical protein
MALRLDLQARLEAILGTGNVYFQPPTNVKIQYPCIVYKRSDADVAFADNQTYRRGWRYQVTVIDSNPDSLVPDRILDELRPNFNRHYTAGNLNHDVFDLYF